MPVSSQMSNRSQEEKSISTLSSGLNLANLAISSRVLEQLWDAISQSQTKVGFEESSDSDSTVQFEVKELTKYNILVFVASPTSEARLLAETDLVPLSSISGFASLHSSWPNSSFSINQTALSLFGSSKADLPALVAQIAEAVKSKSYIITGAGISGSVASLFTLQLLNSLDTKKAKPPLCITFGSPPLVDSGRQRANSGYKIWNSRFLHVVSMDVKPNLPADGQTTGPTSTYHPFGRFMFCSKPGGACFEDPKSALILLRKMNAESAQYEQSFDYGSIIKSLRKGLICKDKTKLNADGTGSSRRKESPAAKRLAAHFELEDVGRNPDLEELLKNETSFLDQKRKALETKAIEFNEYKEYMILMEWYKKDSENKGIPYYDSYKNKSALEDFKPNTFKASLQNYWECQVKEANHKPQKTDAALRNRWLLGGTTYRKLVEPLAIADHYRLKKPKDYITERSSNEKLKHYELLEEWFKVDPASKNTKNQNAPPSLTVDSCFWAHVEEAMISCQNVIKGESTSIEIGKLKKFEEYVFACIRNYEVSSDIFLGKSSFMKWWEDYKKILDQKLMDTSYTSPLDGIMHEGTYSLYESGELFH